MSNIIITISLLAVFVVLVLGLFNMMRGGSPNRSQNLMRLRVLFQFLAILIVVLIVWLNQHK